MLPHYAELFCFSNFTFLHGASHAEELVARAVKLGYHALAITDECSLAGVVRAHDEAKKQGLTLLIGSYFQLSEDVDDPELGQMRLIVIAQNREGYGNLCELITQARLRQDVTKGSYRLQAHDFSHPIESLHHIRALPHCLLILLPDYPIDHTCFERQVTWAKALFGERLYLGLNLLMQAMDDWQQYQVQRIAQQAQLPVVALGHVCMHVRSRKPLQDTLTAIRVSKPIAECGYELAPNAEQHLRSRLRLGNIYPAASLQETIRLANRCNFSLDELRYEYPDELVPAGMTPAVYLRQEVYKGAQKRYPHGVPNEVRNKIEHELHLINDLAYEAYFLTVYDIVRYARSQDILCQGRGSAANSVVCYCLHITEVSPENGILLFERFLSKERGEPPDIDVDFEHQRREEVIQYLYRKYGRHRTALAAAVHTYRPRGALREVGKALGVDMSLIDAVAKSHRWFDSKHALLERFTESGLDPHSPIAEQWASLVTQLLGFPRHLSQHSGGFVIARDKLSRLVPIENASMKDRSVIQWDKDDLESLGLLKVDVLALGMLSALKRSLNLMATLPGRPSQIQDIPQEDKATYDMICKADTVGVFQIESRAQMGMLPRLRPRTFYDLVIQVAIVRPGPIQGGMVHPYLRRRQGLEPVSYPKPAIERILSRTLGVPIFQEQVMQIAMAAADFSPGEADELRRAMAAWKRKGGLMHYKDRIINTMVKNGYEESFASGVFNQMLGFGEYGFPESHAASFALLTYASCWIKCHEPAVFLCSLLNSQPMGFYSPSQLVQDARRHGIEIRPIDVAFSDWDARLEDVEQSAPMLTESRKHHEQISPERLRQPAVRLGMSLLRNMSQEAAQRISLARRERAFSDVNDLARRAQLRRADVEALAAGNALRSLAGHRRQAIWQAIAAVPDKDLLHATTLEEAPAHLAAPSEAQEIVGDYHSQGLTLGRHPIALLRQRLLKQRFLPADVLHTFQNRQFARGCGIVTVRQRPGTAKGVLFVTIEDETGPINVIVWPDLVEKQRREVLNARLLGVYGIWQTDGRVHHLIAKRLVDLTHLLGELESGSRNFC
ncbi:error-prone DNA polymerase [Undibacterium cyanobacteriorum]|uniref:Error-prone DNA polymerase n=1 Tax=Undibacterium cyanobacteriorum TaxID=3073561 RepID=A0ABY9RF34_9BURK|nr:error-prone DNA polymerase [Undibacterium sp. 20NA77.5]WMW78925.1 error-prone DNA polymerase [Undibacterium sp. 20NA77.5]